MASNRATGTALFGWCLPDMPPSQHEKCKHFSGPADNPRECPCGCHKGLDITKKKKTTKRKVKNG